MYTAASGRSFDFASYEKEQVMPKYVIEREMPGVTELSRDELQGASQTSNEALSSMGGDVRWIQSFVTEDKIFCVYIAPSPERIREHANLAGLRQPDPPGRPDHRPHHRRGQARRGSGVIRRALVAAGCVLAATVVSGCDHSAAFAHVVCQLSGGEVYSGLYPGIRCRHFGDEPARRLERRGAPPAADRFRASIRARVVRRPKIRRRGDTGRANGMRHRGTLRIKPSRRTRRTLRGFTKGRFASRVNLRAGGRDGLGTIDGYMAVGFGRAAHRACAFRPR